MTVLYVGIDVACAELEVAVWTAQGGQRLGSWPNEAAGWTGLADCLAAQPGAEAGIHLVLEPTGGYELGVVAFAQAQGWQVSLPNPLRVRRWREGQGRRAKTDGQDALLLAEYGAKEQPQAQDPLPPEVQELAELLARREDLAQMRQQERNRQGNLSHRPHLPAAVPANVQQVLDALDQALADLDQAIAEQLARYPDLAAAQRRLLSVAGVGQGSVLYLLVFLHRWQALTGGQGDSQGLTAYAGLDPQPYQSGSSVYRRPTISRMGHRQMRRRLFLCALGGVRGDNPLRIFYERLLGRNKPKKVALIAAARKILVWAWAVFRDQTPFDPAKALPPAFAKIAS